jgi:sugar lactone lactonase YvrE
LCLLAASCLSTGRLAAWAVTAQEAAGQPEAAAPPVELKQIAAFAEHPDWVTSVAFSPDGKLLAAGTYETVKLWDVAAKQEVAALKTKGFVRSVAFSPDGKLLATGGYQNATLWNVATRASQSVLTGHRGYVTGTAFSPDGKWLATSSEDETAKIWDVGTGKAAVTLTGHAYPVTAIAFAPTGNLVATAAGDVTRTTRPGEVKLWDIPSGQLRHTLPNHERVATTVAFSPDGRLVASGGLDEIVRVCDVATGKELRIYKEHSRPVNSLAFSPDGKLVASGSGGRFVNGNELRIWEPLTGTDRAVVEFEARVTAVAFAPDGKSLATGSYDKTAAVWDTSPLLALADSPAPAAAQPKELRAGIIGLDTSHAIAFTTILNDPDAKEDVAHCKVVAAYPKGSPDIESSVKRVPEYIKAVEAKGVEIVDSIDELLKKVDVVFLETNDGRPHLEQVLPVLKAGKPVFIDKPIAASLADTLAIFEAAEKYKVPMFSSSSLRYTTGAQALRNGKIGDIVGCDAYSPCSLEKTHPDLFWYGIHGVETLFTVMGTGCESVSRTSTPGLDVAVGTWKGGRVGTFRGIREGKGGYGGTAFGTKGVDQIGPYESYRPLLVEIVKCFRTGVVPIRPEETIEIYAFMEAADESKRQGGCPVTLESVLAKARAELQKRDAAK